MGVIFAAMAGSALAAEKTAEIKPYPGVVALSQESPGVWIYKSFPAFLPLYIFDGEPPGKSICDSVCSQVWPIIRAENKANPVGDWTIVDRDDGRRQWAFKNRVVYTYFEDSPNDARGVGKDQDWYLHEGGLAYLIKAGVVLPADFTLTGLKASEKSATTSRLLQP